MGFLFGGGGGGKKAPPPTPAPPPPTRHNNPVLDAISFNQYKAIYGKGGSYAKALMGKSAPNPTKSYTAGLFSSSGNGV